jgi:hypothetical protein
MEASMATVVELLSPQEYSALFRVAARLRSGEFYHFKTPGLISHLDYQHYYSVVTRGTDPRIFDMSMIYDAPCGKIGCIARWVGEELGYQDPMRYYRETLYVGQDADVVHRARAKLLWPLMCPRSRHQTPEMAADAIDRFLLTGSPNWRDI